MIVVVLNSISLRDTVDHKRGWYDLIVRYAVIGVAKWGQEALPQLKCH